MPEHEATFAVGSQGDAVRVILILQFVGALGKGHDVHIRNRLSSLFRDCLAGNGGTRGPADVLVALLLRLEHNF